MVDVLRKIFRIRAIGHTGTLDPSATGLMIMLLGRATKIAPFISGLDKCYQAGICLGKLSDTGDAEGRLTDSGDASAISKDNAESALQTLRGRIALKIPSYAAVHSDGKRRYEIARAGQTPPPLEREALIHSAGIVSFENPVLTIRIRCSAGTYIRSYAEAVGDALGCGAYLASLHREEIGSWRVRDAIPLRRPVASERGEDCLGALRPLEEFLPFPRVYVRDGTAPFIANGRSITPAMVSTIDGAFGATDNVLICGPDKRAIAIVTARFDSSTWPPGNLPGELFTYQRVLIT